MGKIDTSEWKEFRVGELFEVKISKSVDKGGLEFAEDGEYDFIGRTPLNNGIQGTLNKLKFEANQEGTYSIAQIGMHVCQYRERKWYASQNLFVLTPFTEKSHKANKFIATVITRYLDCAYGEDTYATYPTIKTLPLLKIKLPVDKTGQPDWAYMESYTANLETKVAESMTLLQAAKNAEKKKVDTREWGEFRVGELFDIKHPAARSEKKYCEGEINYVSSGAFNNGVANKLMPLPNELLDRGGCITVSPLDGSSFYQEEDFLGRGGSGASISILYNSHLNRNNALFICSVIRSSANGFGYTDLLNGENLKSLTIKLPVDKTGQPDWEYMEEYMRKVEKKANDVLNFLDRISTRRKIDGV